MNIIEATKTCFKKYATFTGRARRSECWWFCLAGCIIPFLILLLFGIVTAIFRTEEPLVLAIQLIGIYELAIIVPSIAVDCRRLHDTGKSGAYLLLALIPLGALIVLIWLIQDSDPNENQYGPNPKLSSATDYTKVCVNCAHTVNRSSRVCPDCGNDPDKRIPYSQPPAKKCANCGRLIDASLSVCPSCGNDPNTRKSYDRPVAKKKCANCGSLIGTSLTVCPNCGNDPNTRRSYNPASAKKKCANCGYSVDISASICPNCGKNPDGGGSGGDAFFVPSL